MSAVCQNVEQTLADVISWRPVLEPVLRAFGPVLSAQSELAAELAGRARALGLSLPEPQVERVRQGVPLLAGANLRGTAGLLRVSAGKLLPLLAKMEALAPHMPGLAACFLPADGEGEPKEADHEALVEAIAARDSQSVERIAKAEGLDPQVLEFVSGFVATPVIRALAATALPDEGQPFWDEGELWRQGYCPVCGAFPSVGWLDRPVVDDKNAFLAGGGGKKHLHCGLCGSNWKFRRGACPSCGEEGNGVIEIMRESGVSHGERLDWCTKCNTYCPIVDLREREFVPDLDAAALCMMHLDMVAVGKNLSPLKASFWNMF